MRVHSKVKLLDLCRDVAVRRWQAYTSKVVFLAASREEPQNHAEQRARSCLPVKEYYISKMYWHWEVLREDGAHPTGGRTTSPAIVIRD